MLPHDGMGGCTPMPRKLNPASNNIADAKLAAEITMIGLMILLLKFKKHLWTNLENKKHIEMLNQP